MESDAKPQDTPTKELSIVSEVTSTLNRCDTPEEVYRVVGREIYELSKHSYVVVTSHEGEMETIRIKEYFGFEGVTELLLRLIGKDPREMIFSPEDMTKEEWQIFTSGKLELLSGGLYTLMTRKIPRRVCDAIEGILGIDRIYTMGFSFKQIPHGGVIIMVKKNEQLRHVHVIETIVSHAANVIYRRKTEEELRITKERLELAFKGANEGLWDWNITTNEVYFSPEWAKTLGYESEEIEGVLESWKARVHPEDMPRVQRALDDHLNGKTPYYKTEHRMKSKSGEWIWILDTGKVVEWDEEGNPVRAVGTHKDITARKKMEKELRESEEKYRLLAENMSDVVFIEDMEFNLQYISPSVSSLLGYSIDELLRLEKREYMKPESFKKAKEGFRTCMELAKKGENEEFPLMRYEYVRKDGSTFWGELQVKFLRDSKGHLTGVQGSLRDITERKKIEEELRENEQKYRSIVENAHSGILIVDENYTCTYVNDKLCEILGYSQNEIIGHDFRDFLDEESTQLVTDRYIRRQRGEDVPSKYEFNVVQKSGEKRRVEIRSTVLKDPEGKLRTVAQILDITERKKAEEALKKQKEELSEFAHTVSHDLKNYIGIIKNRAQFTLIEKNKAEENVKKIIDTTEKMEHFVKKQLELADAGRAIGEMTYTDLATVLGNVAENYEIKLKLEDLPSIRGDPERLEEIFSNLIENAIVHGEASEIEICSRKKEGFCAITVKDNGRGIPEEEIEKIFDTGYSTSGTGFGLSIVQKIVEAHNGSIVVDSKEEKGTIFEIVFPQEK